MLHDPLTVAEVLTNSKLQESYEEKKIKVSKEDLEKIQSIVKESILNARINTAGTRYIQVDKQFRRDMYSAWLVYKNGHYTKKELAKQIALSIDYEVSEFTVLEYIREFEDGYDPNNLLNHCGLETAVEIVLNDYIKDTE